MPNPSRWADAVTRAHAAGFLEPGNDRVDDVGSSDDDVAAVVTIVDIVRRYGLHVGSWDEPYWSVDRLRDGRWPTPSMLTADELEILEHAKDLVPDAAARLRICDTIAIRSAGKDRVTAFAAVITHIHTTLPTTAWGHDEFFAVDRALDIAPRFGPVTRAPGDALEVALVERFRTSGLWDEQVRIPEHLRQHGRARSEALKIAERLRDLALASTDLGRARTLRDEASAWRQIAGDDAGRLDDIVASAVILRDIARGLLDEHKPDAAAHARGEAQLALKRVKLVPKVERASRGADGLYEELHALIRRAGVATLGLMQPMRTPLPDLTSLREGFATSISGHTADEAMKRFLHSLPFTDYEQAKASATASMEKFPLVHLFAHHQFAHDGRAVARSSQDAEPVYGVPSPMWRTMVREFGGRIGLVTNALLAPGWEAMMKDHSLGLADFVRVTQDSALVPADREVLIAQALLYGYNGDFLTAAQLLAPQLENIVRVTLNANGLRTTVTTDGIETESGLSTLVKEDEFENIFHVDVAFEIRALFCSAVGPNLRNEYAHGLVGDSHRNSAHAMYAWWMMWKLISGARFVPRTPPHAA